MAIQEASKNQQFTRPPIDYDPGNVEGHIVLKSTTPCFEEKTFIVGYDWEEEDFGGYMGPRRIQVPVIERQQVFTGYKYTWQVCTPDEYERFAARFN